MKHNFFQKWTSLVLAVLMVISLVPVFTLTASAAGATYTWTRVTSVDTLKAGGEFIIGYEATANSGVIIPMANTGTATLSSQGVMYSGKSASYGGKDTLDMSTYTEAGDKYIVTIAESTAKSGNISIKTENGFIGNANTKNNCKLFAKDSTANGTSFAATIGENDVITLKNDNTKYHTFQYNSGDPRFACYGGTQKNLVIYQRITPHEHSYAWNGTVGTDGRHTLTCSNADGKCDATTITEDCTWDHGYCSVCGAEAPKCAHPTPTEVPGVPANCTESGYTAGVWCDDCKQYISGHEVIDALGHTEVVDEAVEATCTETGMTEGSHCSVCEEIIIAQTVIPAKGHSYVDGVCEVCGAVKPLTAGFVSSGLGLSNGEAFSSEKDGNVTFSAARGEGNNAPAYYTSGNALRIYAKNTFSISVESGCQIVSVTIKSQSGYVPTASNCSVDNGEATGLGTTEVVITPIDATRTITLTNAANSGQFRITEISVEYTVAAPTVQSVSLSLNEGVTVNVTMNIPEAWLTANAGAKVVFSNGKQIDAVAGESAYTVDLTPAQINDALTVRIEREGTVVLDAVDVSVAAYREKAIANGNAEDSALIKLIDAALAYADAADGTGADLANDFADVDDATVRHANDAKLFAGFSGTLGTYASVYVRVNTELIQESETLSITLGGTEIYNGSMAEKVSGGFIVIDQLYPANFDAVISIVAETEGSRAEFTFNSYLKAVYEAATNQQVKNFAVATYLYGLAAEAYLAAV